MIPKQPTTWEHRTTWQFTVILSTGAVMACLLLFAGALTRTADGKNECVATRDAKLLKLRENELRTTGERLLQVFRSRDTKAFFRLVHEQYFGVGEGQNYTVDRLREAFRARADMYCYLFDSRCIPPDSSTDNSKHLSFNDLAARPGSKIKQVEVWHGEGIEKAGCTGTVTFGWVAVEGEELVPSNASTFTFVYERGQWKTVGFDESLVVRIRQPR